MMKPPDRSSGERTMTYELKPSDVMDLRASVRWRLTSPKGPSHLPYIASCRADIMTMNAPGYHPDAFALFIEGHLCAISPRIEVLGACLHAEWAEPGFVRRIMDPREDCEVALNPDMVAAERTKQAFAAKAAREQAEALERSRRRKPTSTMDPTTFKLEL